MTPGRFNLVSQVGRVPSMAVPLDSGQESRFQRLMEESIMIDLHQHPMVHAGGRQPVLGVSA